MSHWGRAGWSRSLGCRCGSRLGRCFLDCRFGSFRGDGCRGRCNRGSFKQTHLLGRFGMITVITRMVVMTNRFIFLLGLAPSIFLWTLGRGFGKQLLLDDNGHIRFDGTRMRLFFRNSQIRQQVQNCLRLDFKLPGQLVNANHMVTLGRIPLNGTVLLNPWLGAFNQNDCVQP